MDSHINNKTLRMVELSLSGASDIFIDALHNDSEDKQCRVEEELQSSQIMLLIKSSSIYKSKWVNRELKIARINNIPIVSVNFVENLSFPDIKTMIRDALLTYNEANKSVNRATQSGAPIGLPLWAAGYT